MTKKIKFNFPYSVCIPKMLGTGGGSATFWNYFMMFLDNHEIPYHRNIFKKSDFMMLNSWQGSYFFYKLSNIIYPGRINVHRINGCAREYGRHGEWDEMQRRINTLANITIHQSGYSRYITSVKNPIVRDDGHIIYNPVDTDLFNPDGEKLSFSGSIRIAFCSFSLNPKKGFADVLKVAQNNSDWTFVIAGRVPESVLPDNMIFLGQLSRSDLSKMMRSCHFFVFFSENEACPNVILEAMASGLPVLYKDSGGTPELVGDAGMGVNVSTFRMGVETLWENHKEFRMKARTRAEEFFSINKIIPSYLSRMRAFIEKQQ